MMLIRFYKNSFLASIVSLIGCGLIYMGIMVTIQEHQPAALAFIPFGLAFFSLAGKISDRKAFKKWCKMIREKGLEDHIRADVAAAVSVYNANPGDRTLKYIASLNPTAAQYIAGNLAQKKAAANH